MTPEPAEVLTALRAGAGAACTLEPVTALGTRAWLATVTAPAGRRTEALVRRHPEPEAAANNAAVLEALTWLKLGVSPRLLGLTASGDAVEAVPEGVPAIAVSVDGLALEGVVAGFAALHGSDLREGLRWGLQPLDIVPVRELQLFRLGFTSDERAAASEAVGALQRLLLEGPFGPVHGLPLATNVHLAPGVVTFVDFGEAGFGSQAFDLATFLLSAGVEPARRRFAAASYAARADLDPVAFADLVDAAGLLWGLEFLMTLPRMEILLYGDDASLAWLRLVAARVSQGIRQPAGNRPEASTLRAALWG